MHQWTGILPVLITATTATTTLLSPTVSWSQEEKEFATSAGRKDCTTVSDPGKTIVVCRGELANLGVTTKSSDEGDGLGGVIRLNGIAATENGVSTSAIKNPSRYAPPWSYLTETSDSVKAWNSLKDTIVSSNEAEIVTDIMNEQFYYLHAIAPTRNPPGLSNAVGNEDGVDDLEFL